MTTINFQKKLLVKADMECWVDSFCVVVLHVVLNTVSIGRPGERIQSI